MEGSTDDRTDESTSYRKYKTTVNISAQIIKSSKSKNIGVCCLIFISNNYDGSKCMTRKFN